jgi:hypothetical protein
MARGEDLSGHDWLLDAWLHLDERSAQILARRLAGDSLADIRRTYGISRQRVSQLALRGQEALLTAQRRHAPDLAEKLSLLLGDNAAVSDSRFAAVLPSAAVTGRDVLLRLLGVVPPRTWGGDLKGWWTRHPGELDVLLREIAAMAPLTCDEARDAATALGLPDDLPLDALLADADGPLSSHPTGWVRRARVTRDAAFLWLRAEGEPRSVGEIAIAVGNSSEHAVRERMRADSSFAQVRPEGTWALTDWRVAGADNRYASAVDVVVEVLREHGPLSFDQLRAESQRRYPVSTWRIQQCLSSNQVGLNDRGLYDLVERGATPIEDQEPRRPESIKTTPDGTLVGIALVVDSDVLRGSGLGVHRWLTWYLGLRTAPSARSFAYADAAGELTVRRATSSSQISSLRTPVLALDLAEGCQIAVLIDLTAETAKVRHTCEAERCPAARDC